MPSPIVTVPADLWVEVVDELCKLLVHKHVSNELIARVTVVDVPDLSPEAEERRARIVELAAEASYDGGVLEIDADAAISEGNDNGCYVSAWVWFPFDDTEFNKCSACSDCGEDVTEDDKYFATPCGTFCDECMGKHMEVCEICRNEFNED